MYINILHFILHSYNTLYIYMYYEDKNVIEDDDNKDKDNNNNAK